MQLRTKLTLLSIGVISAAIAACSSDNGNGTPSGGGGGGGGAAAAGRSGGGAPSGGKGGAPQAGDVGMDAGSAGMDVNNAGSAGMDMGEGGMGGAPEPAVEFSAQLPPEGAAAVEAWLATKAYKHWTCEGAVHANRAPSPHGFNRICTNDALTAGALSTTPWAKGSAAVKELYTSLTATTPSGYAVSIKTDADSKGGANWYWYQRKPTGEVADGLGVTGCVSCHVGAGSDPAHTPSLGGRDQVYTPVSQVPPQGTADLDAWLATGAYKLWNCEGKVHANRAPSPHGFNRICSNDALAAAAAGTAPWPEGAASVKELYTLETDTTPSGYAVGIKTAADSAAGANWYWYEKTGATVVADAKGFAGCVACHNGAGSDAQHSGRDQVYTAVTQIPPSGAVALDAWLATAAYKLWNCEPAPHASRAPSPHGFNRICSNEAVSGVAAGSGAWPAGAASVKELFASATDTTPTGYAVTVKLAASSAAGANWYWYEKTGATVVADGNGAALCVSCHNGAGSDAMHTPTPGGRDELYTAVR